MHLNVFLLYVDLILGSKSKTQQRTKVNVNVQFINRLSNVVCESWWANADSATSCNESLRLLRFPFFFRCRFRVDICWLWQRLCLVELLSVMMGCWCPWLGSWRMHFRLRLYRFPFSVSIRYERGPTFATHEPLSHGALGFTGWRRTGSPIWSSGNGLALLS